MHRFLLTAFLGAAMAGLPVVVGCDKDKTVEEKHTVETKPDGATVEKKKTVEKESDGTVKTKETVDVDK